jgi:predicted RNA binding protein YcfA (HicA-like mRNA interferase family)
MDGTQLAKRLGRFGYAVTRQVGSHMRLATRRGGEHHVTIPAHNPLRVGTLNSVLSDVSSHLGISREELLAQILD